LFPPRYIHAYYILQDGRKKKKIWRRRLHKHKKRINKYKSNWLMMTVCADERKTVSVILIQFRRRAVSVYSVGFFFHFYYIFQLMNYIQSSVLDATTWQPFSFEGC
jgi:hypothetical protein